MKDSAYILQFFDDIEELNPDESLEWLTAVTADTAGCEAHEVVAALVFRAQNQDVTPSNQPTGDNHDG